MTIEVETGPMFSGKSTELKRCINQLESSGKLQGVDFLVYNYIKDTRYGENILGTHSGDKCFATPISCSQDIFLDIFTLDENNLLTLKPNRNDLQDIFIDEAQFFDSQLGYILDFVDNYYLSLRGQGLRICCAGLDLDFRGEPFHTMTDLISRSARVNKLTATCDTCGEAAPYTQRLVNQKPASYNDPIVLIGAKSHYTARCSKHHQVPNKP